MKKMLFIVLATALFLSLTACTGDLTVQETGHGQSSSPADTEDIQPVDTGEVQAAPAASSDASEKDTDAKVLIAYFSATGTTKSIAQSIAEATGGDLFEIVPADPYSSDDLNYNNDTCRANQEQQDDNARPAISGSIQNMDSYDIVFIGHPIWWGQEPRIIDTFVETYDLSGKTVINFCTSGSSGISTSESNLKSLCSDDIIWLPGKRFPANADLTEVQEWLDQLAITAS